MTAAPTVERRRKKTASEQARRRRIAYGRHQPAYTDATGTRRRIQALMAAGWTLARQAALLGRDDSCYGEILHAKTVTLATARAVAALYTAIRDRPPPQADRWEKAASTSARRYAAARGWPAAREWGDFPGLHWIDDPDAWPASGWKRQGAA